MRSRVLNTSCTQFPITWAGWAVDTTPRMHAQRTMVNGMSSTTHRRVLCATLQRSLEAHHTFYTINAIRNWLRSRAGGNCFCFRGSYEGGLHVSLRSFYTYSRFLS